MEYKKFRDVGISPDMMDMYDKMFKDTIAEGKCVMIPSSGILPGEIMGDSEDDFISVHDEENESTHTETIKVAQSNEDKGKKRTNSGDKGVMGGSKGKKGKVGGAAKLAKQIDRLVEVVESRSTATSVSA